ncbi:hypothetical protein EGW08_013451 [Elysia chlorotica]|uniref:tRNA wybutosine-synthesizing protein 4 n=1 Tax=Elysia chlorotica TaxID=188477 RepID=A0A3S1HGA8_ELYCH|nr:hypothetical protein EGW08_013451 [Elysia chlorotica]
MAKVVSANSNKNSKTRRETAVQGTNDSSIVSKWSTASSGYFDDSFLQYFISKQSRRAPLIHRGYYIRAKAFDKIIRNFLKIFENSKKQIISLGTGFDSTYFRLKGAGLLSDTVVYEIDFPELVRRKRLLIESSPELANLIQKYDIQPSSPHIELSCTDYQLLGVDLTQLNTLEAALKMCGIRFECPTLLLSECVMTYMTRRCSTELVKWAAETFEQGVFVIYEQMHPNDAFGLFMQAHFNSIGSPLKCINSFPNLRSQNDRFLNAGWTYCESVDMNTFYYDCLDRTERSRVESLETFDEYEELNLKYSHYFILTAATISLGQSLIRNNQILSKPELPEEFTDVVTVSRLPEEDQSVRRFGHASSLVMDCFAITSGGFGETDGRHQRLAELTVTDLSSLTSYHVSCGVTDMQIPRMHHSSSTLSNGATILIAGRQSPYFMCNEMLKVTLKIADNMDTVHGSSTSPAAQSVKCEPISKENCSNSLLSNAEDDVISEACNGNKGSSQSLETHKLSKPFDFQLGSLTIEVMEQKGNVPRERWRHASVVVMHEGEEKIFLYGGKTKSGQVLEDCFIFNPSTSTWNECVCSGTSPGLLHSHCLTYWQGQVILTGGLNKNHEPTNQVFGLDLNTMTWNKWDLDGPLYARYSHTAHLHDNTLILVGGVNTEEKPPGLAVISLISHTAFEFAFPSQDKQSLLMLHRHTSVMRQNPTGNTTPQLVLLGGGGNCFSFGTHLNRTPVLVNVEAACASVHEARSK